MNHRVIIGILLLSIVQTLFAEDKRHLLNRPLQAEQRFIPVAGLEQFSNPVVNDIIQDSKGFIWIATGDGLNRYDGYNVVVYRHNPGDPNSLSHFAVSSLEIDKSGKLWIGTENGLNLYNSEHDNFIRYNNSRSDDIQLPGLRITNIFSDSQNRLWIGSSTQGVSLLSTDRKHIQSFKYKLDDSGFLVENYIESIVEDSRQVIWIATRKGINKFQDRSNNFLRFNIFRKKDARNRRIEIKDMMLENKDELLLATNSGLFLFNLHTGNTENISNGPLQGQFLYNIVPLSNNEKLIGSFTNGLFHIDGNYQIVNQYINNSNNKYSIPSNQISSSYHDKDGLVWIGTNIGLSIYNTKPVFFQHYHSQSNTPDCLAGDTIYSVFAGNSSKLWIAVDEKGLNFINRATGQCHLFKTMNASGHEIPLSTISAIYEDVNQQLWIGTFDNGMLKIDLQTNYTYYYKPIENDSSSISSLNINAIMGDKQGNIWIATYGGGLNYYDRLTEKFTRYMRNADQSEGISSNYIFDLFISKQGHVWAATPNKGLERYDPGAGVFFHYVRETIDSEGIPFSLRSIAGDRDDNIWIGSRGYGAFRLDTKTNSLKKFDVNNGLVNNTILSIEVDNANNVWLFSDGGITRIDKDLTSIVNFDESDGLQANNFTNGSYYNSSTDEMWTGGINGFNYFKLGDFTLSQKKIMPTITGFELFNEPLNSKTSSLDSILNDNINSTKEIVLRYEQNAITFHFSALQFTKQQDISYSYILEGNEKKWTQVNANNRLANYTNLSPGNYIFKVKAAYEDGQWGSVRSIKVVITPPWWQTISAFIMFLIMFILSVFFVIKLRTKTLQKRAEELEHNVAIKTEQLSKEKHKVEQLLSKKNEEFTNVSHEFKTPLALILGPVEQLIKSSEHDDENSRLKTIQRNAYRLLRMVDQLLNLETFRIRSITQKTPQAIGKNIILLTEAFQDLAKEKEITLINAGIVNINFEFTLDAIEKIIVNLLSNAIKYTKPGGKITIQAVRTNNNYLKVHVKDTGIGIPADKLDSVFERYSRVLDEKSEQITGAGIGLALVKNLVESHQGRIDIESKMGEGTSIHLYLPIINEASDSDVNPHKSDEIITMELMSLGNQATAATSSSQNYKFHSQSNAALVLVIEDNVDMRQYIIDSIAENYQVITANNGEDGVKLAISEIPDLIISDIMMPKLDGYGVVEQLRSNFLTNHIPVILLTARSDRDSRLKAWREKADEYLTKPFDTEELNLRLENLYEIRNILKKRFAQQTFHRTESSDSVVEQNVQSNDLNYTKQQKIFLDKLNITIEILYKDHDISVSDIASKLAVSERQLHRKLKSILDLTPAEYLKRIRLEKAKKYLADGESVSLVITEVGFTTHSNFSKCFKAQFGVSPRDYKKLKSGEMLN